jgi:hypothetical protein
MGCYYLILALKKYIGRKNKNGRMKKIWSNKKIMLALLIVSSITFIAGAPVADDKTLLEQMIAAFPSAVVSPEEQQASKQSLDNVWTEVEKLAENNPEDSLYMSGTIRLYDDGDENGIKETQHFSLHQQGDNQWFTLDSFARIQMGPNLLMIDHVEREIVSQQFSDKVDSVKEALNILEPQKLKELLEKNGTTAEITKKDGLTILTINPGTMDQVNEYNIFYDSAYQIKKFTLSYSSVPYQDLFENYDDKKKDNMAMDSIVDDTKLGDSANIDDLELNITEYVVEYTIDKKEKTSNINFFDNAFFKVGEKGDLKFKGKLINYKKVKY